MPRELEGTGSQTARPKTTSTKATKEKASWAARAAVGVASLALVGGFILVRSGTVPSHARGAVHGRTASTTASPQPFVAAQVSGGSYRLVDVGGRTVVFPNRRPALLYFMSASCSSCWQGNSQIARIYPKLRREAQIVSLDVTPQVDSALQVKRMARLTGAGWPQAFATPSILNRFGISYLDTAVVLSPAGKVIYDGQVPSNGRLLSLIQEAGASKPA